MDTVDAARVEIGNDGLGGRRSVAGPRRIQRAAVTGEVVWDGNGQRGFARFVGLPRNDPTKEQYQLWIFDATRDERFPVDGGVFDVEQDGTVVVRIQPKVSINAPTLFAVTVEEPGGVVVSDRSRLVATAPI